LSELVRAPEQLARRLSQIGVCDDEQGPALQSQLQVGQVLVSRAGAVWRWDGVTASADAPTPAALRLAQKNRLAELEAEALQAAEALRTAEDVLARAEARVKQAVEDERRAREALREAQRAASEARDALARAEKAAGELSSRRDALVDARERLAETASEAAESVEEAQIALAEAPDLTELQIQLDRLAKDVAEDRARLADARAAHEGLGREAEARTRRLAAIQVERESWIERAANADRQIASLRERREEAAAEYEALAEAPDEIDERRRSLMSELSKAEAAQREANDRLQTAETKQAQADRAATEAIQALSEAREARGRAEERLTAADERRREAEARIQEVLNVPAHLVLKHAGLDADAPLPDIGETERNLERLKIERERLGAVNLRAEEEQRELVERHGTIISEREDVIEAIRKLRQAIQSLNREGRERLLAAFEVVNTQFQRLFTHLFGGGTAELQLIESDDPL